MTHLPTRRIAAASILLGLALAGCGTGITPEAKAQQCDDFAKDVVIAHLALAPEEKPVTDAANAMDERVNQVGDPVAHDAALELHNQLHSLQGALHDGDQERADRVLARARTAAKEAAKACGLPEERFLGTPS